MNKENMKYVKKGNNIKKLIRTEMLFTPLLIVLPLIVGFYLLFDWYFRGFIIGDASYNSQFFIGIFLIVGNIVFDIPFIISLKTFGKEEKT
jgi:hypothetical protein